MSTNQLMKWLNKTSSSISSFIYNGGEMKHQRGLDLLDRYNDLVDEMKENRWEDWKSYCDSYGFSYSHDGYDSFA